MKVPRELLEAAVAMRGAEPIIWQHFLVGMRLYAAQITSDMIRCPPELLLKAQGMAQSITELSQTFQTAPEQLEAMTRSQHGKDPRTRSSSGFA